MQPPALNSKAQAILSPCAVAYKPGGRRLVSPTSAASVIVLGGCASFLLEGSTKGIHGRKVAGCFDAQRICAPFVWIGALVPCIAGRRIPVSSL